MFSQRATTPIPFGLSLSKPFDKLRANGEFPIILSLSKDRLSANGFMAFQ